MVENLLFLAEQMAILLCLCGLFGRKFKLDILTMVALVVNMVLFNFRYYGYIGPLYSVMVSIVLFVYSLYEYRESIKVTIVNNILYVIIMLILQMAFSVVMVLLKNVFTDKNVLMLVINVLILLVVLMIKGKFRSISKYISTNRWLSLIPIFICGFILISLLISFKSYDYLKNEVGIITCVFTVLVIALLHKWYEAKAEVESKAKELEASAEYTAKYEKLIDEVRKKQHNFRNHLSAICSQHYTSENYEEYVAVQKEYCKYVEGEGRHDKLLTVNIPVLAGFLYSKFNEIEDSKIKVEYSCKVQTDTLPIPLYEVITILGIFLDNAKEKVEEEEEDNRIIKFVSEEDDKYISFYVLNKSEYIKFDDIARLFSNGYSSKGRNRGIGLNIVKDKALQYGFDAYVSNEEINNENWISFGIKLKKNT